MITLKKVFAKNLKDLMRRDGVKGVRIVKDIGVSPAAVTKWTHATAFPESDTIDKLRRKYGWLIKELFDT